MAETDLNKLDLEQEVKRAKSLLKSPEGRAALRQVTGYHLILPGEVEREQKPIVVLLTPSHQGIKPEAQTAIERMIRASANHATVIPDPYVHSSVVSWGRNELLARLFKSGRAFDYVLWIDDDMVPPEDALVKLLAHNVDIVSAACTTRYDPPKPNWRLYKPDTYSYHTALDWSRDGLIPYGGVGTGFLLIKREVIQKVADYYLSCEHLKRYFLTPISIGAGGKVKFEKFDEKRLPDWLKQNLEHIQNWRFEEMKKTHNAWWFEFLKNPVGEGEWGEDISFCHKAHVLGIPMYVDTTVRVGHLGAYAYGVDNYLECRDAVMADQQGKEMVAALTGEATSVPTVEQPFKATRKVSVLLPSRGKPEPMKSAVASLLDNAEGEVEILVRLDSDDDTCFLSDDPRVEVTRGNHQEQYYDELAQKATGDWLLLWNDDAQMQTKGWDTLIHQQGGGLKVLNAGDRRNLFPIVSKELYSLLGSFGPGANCGASLQVVSRLNGIEYPVELSIKHDGEEKSLEAFFSEERQARLWADVEKVKAALRAQAQAEEITVTA